MGRGSSRGTGPASGREGDTGAAGGKLAVCMGIAPRDGREPRDGPLGRLGARITAAAAGKKPNVRELANYSGHTANKCRVGFKTRLPRKNLKTKQN